MKKRLKYTFQPIILTGLLLGSLLSGQSYAATVSVDPMSTSVGMNTDFSVQLRGSDFNNVSGFGLDLKWDSTIATLLSAIVDGTAWEFTTSNAGGSAHAIGAGTATGIGGTSFAGRSGDVRLVQLNFRSLGKVGSTQLQLSASASPVWLWADANGTIVPVLNDDGITVVPVPAALWFAFTGIFSLGLFRRRQVSS